LESPPHEPLTGGQEDILSSLKLPKTQQNCRLQPALSIAEAVLALREMAGGEGGSPKKLGKESMKIPKLRAQSGSTLIPAFSQKEKEKGPQPLAKSGVPLLMMLS
jgi:hypothetical protein